MINFESIEKFIKATDTKITYSFDLNPNNELCIYVRARYKGNLQIFLMDCFRKDFEGMVEWKEYEVHTGPEQGIFHYLGDDTAVLNYFLDQTTKKAVQFYRQKTDSSS